jgi:hypothetical protein
MNIKVSALSLTFLLLLVFFLALMIPSVADETPPDWTDDRRLTQINDYTSTRPKIDTDSENNLHMVYNDYRHGPPEIYYMKLDGQGNILIDETLITVQDAATSYHVDVACDSNDNVHIIWSDVRDTGPVSNIELYYEKMDNMGNTLVDEMRITHAPHYSLYPSITIDSNDNLHIVWSEEVNVMSVLQEEIYYTKLDNNGNTLVDDLALTGNDGEESLFPDCEADSAGNIHVVWLDDRNETGSTKNQDVYYTKLDNFGNTIIDDTRTFVRADHFRPNIVIDSNDLIHLICGSMPNWKGNVHKQVYYMKLDNAGDPLVDEKRLTSDEENASHPALHLDSEENIHIVWEDERHENTEIYYMKVDNLGKALIDEQRLTVNPSKSQFPEIEMDLNDNAKVVWADGRDYIDGDMVEIYYKRSMEAIINSPPTVTITSPFENQTVLDSVIIQGTADDVDGSIQYVEIKIDFTNWITVTGTNSWNYEWNSNSVSNGVHRIYARSFDGTLYSEEYLINVTVDNDVVNNPPIVTINHPDENDIVSATVSVSGTASDPDGNLQKVEISIDNKGWIIAAGTSSWAYSWDTTKNQDGKHVIYARAKDDSNQYSTTKSISVIVDNFINSPPTVNFTSPTEDTVSEEVEIRGTAADADGDDTLTLIEVKIDDDWNLASGTIDWTYDWDTESLDDGYYIISVRAFDGTDYSIIKSISVYVDNPHAPTVVVTSGIPEKASGTIIIFGTASDVDGVIVKIEVQVDSGEWKEIRGTSEWTYLLDTKELENGEHTIRILATDDEGEFHMEILTFEVENPQEFPMWILLLIIVIVILLGIIIGVIAKKKGI